MVHQGRAAGPSLAGTGSHDRIERLLDASASGDRGALDELYRLLYDELRILAHRHLRDQHDPAAHTLGTTALVHESYLRLAGGAMPRGRARAQFFAVASRAMRSILVDHARRRGAAKRGGDAVRVTLEEGIATTGETGVDLLGLDTALSRLAEKLPRLAAIVECRFFGGMTVPETAAALDVSVRSVERDWTRARAYLAKLL